MAAAAAVAVMVVLSKNCIRKDPRHYRKPMEFKLQPLPSRASGPAPPLHLVLVVMVVT